MWVFTVVLSLQPPLPTVVCLATEELQLKMFAN